MTGLRVDHDLCEGSRLCVGTHPTLFEMDGHFAVVKDPGAVAELSDDDVDDIVFLCPASAIQRVEGHEDGPA